MRVIVTNSNIETKVVYLIIRIKKNEKRLLKRKRERILSIFW